MGHSFFPTVVVWALAAPMFAVAQTPVTEVPAGTRRALIICGHPGDDEFRVLYAEAVTRLRAGLTENLGFAPEATTVFFGVDPDEEPTLEFETAGPATREALAAVVVRLREQLQPADTLWVITIGHAHFDNRLAWLNLPGDDLHHDDFGKLFNGLACQEMVFWITHPVSGFFLKPLSGSGRVAISATEADLEVNATLFPFALAEEVNRTDGQPLDDADGDGVLSVFDLYIATTRNTAQQYVVEALLATEHGLLEDNGDGRPTEVQRDYLTEEAGGRPGPPVRPVLRPGQDGAAAAKMLLPLGPVSALSAVRELGE